MYRLLLTSCKDMFYSFNCRAQKVTARYSSLFAELVDSKFKSRNIYHAAHITLYIIRHRA